MGRRNWLRAVLKVVVMAATMCSGINVPRHDSLGGNEQGERDRRPDRQDLGQTTKKVPVS